MIDETLSHISSVSSAGTGVPVSQCHFEIGSKFPERCTFAVPST
ncbi:hypothetical protein ABZ114_03065 [Streptomyces albidoflavus]